MGDYFGAAVNLAARVSAGANGGEVLLTGHTAALAPQLEGVIYEPRGRRALRNVPRLSWTTMNSYANPPSCKSSFAPRTSISSATWGEHPVRASGV